MQWYQTQTKTLRKAEKYFARLLKTLALLCISLKCICPFSERWTTHLCIKELKKFLLTSGILVFKSSQFKFSQVPDVNEWHGVVGDLFQPFAVQYSSEESQRAVHFRVEHRAWNKSFKSISWCTYMNWGLNSGEGCWKLELLGISFNLLQFNISFNSLTVYLLLSKVHFTDLYKDSTT